MLTIREILWKIFVNRLKLASNIKILSAVSLVGRMKWHIINTLV